MRIIIYVGYDQPDAEIQTNNDHKPRDGRDTTAAECPTMNQNKDTVSADQPENSARCADADILRRKVETCDNTGHACQQVNQ